MSCPEFVEVGGELILANFSTPEARYRSAVGRAYYGAYHEACEFARSLGGTVHGNNHDLVIGELYRLARENNDGEIKKVAIALKSLHGSRKKADYHFTARDRASFLDDRFSSTCVADGHSILRQIQSLRRKYANRA